MAGTLTVVALYFTVRGLFRRNGRWLAATTALALAVSYWHIHFSHYGIRVILMPLLLCGVFGLFWLGMHGGSQAHAPAGRPGLRRAWPASACGPTPPAVLRRLW